MDDDRETILNELRRIGLGDIWYPGAAGCAGAKVGFGGTPGPCQREVVAVALKRYRYPRPVTARVLLCVEHALLEDVVPITEDDRVELRRRRERESYWDRVRAHRLAGHRGHHEDLPS